MFPFWEDPGDLAAASFPPLDEMEEPVVSQLLLTSSIQSVIEMRMVWRRSNPNIFFYFRGCVAVSFVWGHSGNSGQKVNVNGRIWGSCCCGKMWWVRVNGGGRLKCLEWFKAWLFTFLSVPSLKFTFPIPHLLSPPASSLPLLSLQRKWVDGPFVIGRVGGALSSAFQAAGAYSKVGVSAPPLGVFVPTPYFPHSPARQKIRAAFFGTCSSGLTLSQTAAFLM